jgi:hypothetical protein
VGSSGQFANTQLNAKDSVMCVEFNKKKGKIYFYWNKVMLANKEAYSNVDKKSYFFFL